mgnify:CR=1 FL=1
MNSIFARYLALSSLLVLKDISVTTAVQARILNGSPDNSFSTYGILPVCWYKAFLIKKRIYNTTLSRARVSHDTNNGGSIDNPFL